MAQYYTLDEAAQKLGLSTPRWLALMCFASFAVYKETLRPPLHKIALSAITQLRRVRDAPQIEEAHMRNRQMIIRWLMANTRAIAERRRSSSAST